MLYELEYWCQLCGKWKSMNWPPFEDGNQALGAARQYSTAIRPVRVVDDFGNVYQ